MLASLGSIRFDGHLAYPTFTDLKAAAALRAHGVEVCVLIALGSVRTPGSSGRLLFPRMHSVMEVDPDVVEVGVAVFPLVTAVRQTRCVSYRAKRRTTSEVSITHAAIVGERFHRRWLRSDRAAVPARRCRSASRAR